MKKILQFTLLLTVLFSFGHDLQAQTPEGFNYQAVARNSSGDLIKNQSISVRTIILSGPGASNKLYEETHVVTTNDFGHFSITVGKGSTSDNFATIDWSLTSHHLKVELDEGSGFAVMGTVQLQSVPYALHSKTAETAKSVENLSLAMDDISDVNSAAASNGEVLKWNGAKWAPAPDNNTITTFTAGSGIDITGANISAKNGDPMWNANKLNGNDVASGTPTKDDVLQYDGSKWAYGANKINGIDVETGTPTKDQVLQYDGSKWAFGSISSGGGSSVWTKSGSDIYFNDGLVGINNTSPTSRLSVRDTITGTGNGFFIMTDNYFSGGPGTGARYVTSRSVLLGGGGFSNIAALNVVGGTMSTSGESIGTMSEVTATGGAVSIGTFGIVSPGASTLTAAVYAEANGRSTNNLGVYTFARESHNGTNYGIFALADSGTTNYAGYFAGDVTYTGTLSGPSDAKLKYNVNDLSDATDIIKKLSPKTYLYKQEGEAAYLNLSEGRQFGFIAQELETVLPELVSKQTQIKGYNEEGNIEYKAVNYIGLIPVLTQALKEQQELIELLEKRITELEANSK